MVLFTMSSVAEALTKMAPPVAEAADWLFLTSKFSVMMMTGAVS